MLPPNHGCRLMHGAWKTRAAFNVSHPTAARRAAIKRQLQRFGLRGVWPPNCLVETYDYGASRKSLAKTWQSASREPGAVRQPSSSSVHEAAWWTIRRRIDTAGKADLTGMWASVRAVR